MAAIFGIFIDIVIACLAGVVVLMGYRPGFGWLLPVLAAVPLVWGALGIFFFNDMLDLAGEIVERFFLQIASWPALIVMLGVTAIPFAITIGLAFTNYDLVRYDTWRFVGLDNFQELLTDRQTPIVIVNTLYLVIATTLIPTVVGLGLATLMEKSIRGIGIVRSLYLLPIMTAPYFEQEVAGIPMLKRLAAALFGERDPAQIFFEGQAYRIEKNADGYVLAVPLPFVDREDVSLLRKESELTLQVGARRRTFALPRVLAGRETRGAGFVEHELHIRFS